MLKLGFQSSKYSSMRLEQELQFAENNKVNFFDIFFDDFVPTDIVNVKIPENFTVGLPINFGELSKEIQQTYFDFINEKKAQTVSIPFSNLTEEQVLEFASKIEHSTLCIENAIPDKNNHNGLCYIQFMKKIIELADKQKIKVAATFDCGNAKVCGYDVVDYLKQILENNIDVCTVHLHDNDGVHDQHRPAGSIYNGINFDEILNILNNLKYDVYGVIDHWNNNYNAMEYLINLQK